MLYDRSLKSRFVQPELYLLVFLCTFKAMSLSVKDSVNDFVNRCSSWTVSLLEVLRAPFWWPKAKRKISPQSEEVEKTQQKPAQKSLYFMISFAYSQVPLSRTRTGNENLFDIAGLGDIRTQNYYTKPYRKTRGNGNLFEIASCSR